MSKRQGNLSRNSRTNLSHTLANHHTQTTKVQTTKINQATTKCYQTGLVKVTKQASRNSRTNLSHTLECNKTKQPTSIIAEKIITAKLTILHHTADKQGSKFSFPSPFICCMM